MSKTVRTAGMRWTQLASYVKMSRLSPFRQTQNVYIYIIQHKQYTYILIYVCIQPSKCFVICLIRLYIYMHIRQKHTHKHKKIQTDLTWATYWCTHFTNSDTFRERFLMRFHLYARLQCDRASSPKNPQKDRNEYNLRTLRDCERPSEFTDEPKKIKYTHKVPHPALILTQKKHTI